VTRPALALALLAACCGTKEGEPPGAPTVPPPEAPAARDERARIEALLAAVETSGLTFVRNGVPHDAKAAVAHLRRKWKRAPRELTAEQFIEKIASRSSTTGRDYLVRIEDGTEAAAGDWFRARLKEIDAR
jgi:hypothetical protein